MNVAQLPSHIAQVKPLGVYAMIDDGELDWKVIAIAVDDPKAALVNDVADVEKCARGSTASGVSPVAALLWCSRPSCTKALRIVLA
jgi:hypothetical protein